MLSTSKERDSETGLDNFLARYFSSAQGRFISPDEPFAGQDSTDPQSWNLFSYGLNNPQRYSDPDGRAPCPGGDNDPNCVEVKATAPKTDAQASTLGELSYLFITTVTATAQQAQRFGSAAWNFVSNPNNWQYPSCVAGKMGTWGAAGTAGGAAVGGIGVALGGVGEFVTVPAGAAIGGGGAISGGISGLVTCSQGSGPSSGGRESSSGDANDGRKPPVKATKLRGNQGWRDENGNIWKKDMLQKDHWDISDRAGNKIKEVTFEWQGTLAKRTQKRPLILASRTRISNMKEPRWGLLLSRRLPP